MNQIVAEKAAAKVVPMVLDFRAPNSQMTKKLIRQGIHPLLASLYSARGVTDVSEVRATFDDLLPTSSLHNCDAMAALLADCIETKKRVLIVSDYDCDGATACTVLLSAFRDCGMNVGYLVPDREIHGYGLTESIVKEAHALPKKPDYIITVDAGISSIDGVALANKLGIKVLVTDHHHAPEILPDAEFIVNPNQHDCKFESKNIAGCGVAFYVAKSLAEELRKRGKRVGYEAADLLQFVAIGTIADVVALDKNNRILVSEGLKRIRSGKCTEGIKALAIVAKKTWPTLSCTDIGFGIGPRINAAGRLAHMSTGIDCLLSTNPEDSARLARELDATNEERKAIQKEMVASAEEKMSEYLARVDASDSGGMSIVVYEASWHQGVIGVVAGRIKEERHRPTFVMCDASSGVIKGSGRSIPGFHLKHALDRIAVECPGVIATHGGHPMAAGVSIHQGKLDEFIVAFERVCREMITPKMLQRLVGHDGGLPDEHLNLNAVKLMNSEVWGQLFPEPLFIDSMKIIGHRTMGDENQHLKLNVALGDVHVDVVAFHQGERAKTLTQEVTVIYKAQINSFRGTDKVQLLADHLPDESVVAQHKKNLMDFEGGVIGDDGEVQIPDVLQATQKKKGFRKL